MGLLTRPFAAVGRWLNDHPFRLAGALTALGGGTVTYLGVGPAATAADLVGFASAHPAYVVAVALGLATLLFVDG